MRARRLCPALLLLPLVVAALTAGAVLAQDGEGSGLGFSAPCLAHLQAYLASVLESPAWATHRRRDGLRSFAFDVLFFVALGLSDLRRGLLRGLVGAATLGVLASATKTASRLSVPCPSYRCSAQHAKTFACTV